MFGAHVLKTSSNGPVGITAAGDHQAADRLAMRQHLQDAWLREATLKNIGNKMAGCGDEQRSRALGLIVTILTTAVGTSVFTSLANSPSQGWKIATGAIGFLAALVGAVQTYMSYGKRSEQHFAAAAKYVKLQRDLERAPLAELPLDDQRKRMQQWEAELVDAETTAPVLSDRVLRRASTWLRLNEPALR